jgi:protease IV
MNIIKRIWRGAVTVKDALALLFLLLFFGALFFSLSSGPMGEMRGGALFLDLDGVIVEQEESADPRSLLTGGGSTQGQLRASEIVRALNVAAADDDIKAVVLNLDGFMGGGQVSIADVGAALDKVRAAKKPVLAYALGYTDDGYLLASHASEIWLDPMGAVLVAGPGGSQPYFKGLADRFGVNVHTYRVGAFKSAIEPYTRTEQSDEAKQASQALYGSLWTEWQALVKKARPQADIAAITKDPGTLAQGKSLASLAQSLKLVDQLGDETSFGARVAKIVGGDDDKGQGDFNHTDLANYLMANPAKSGGTKIAQINIVGAIVDGEADPGTAGGDTISRLIRQAMEDEDVKALVVRVDSPGGSAMASEKIRLALAEARAKKLPVIISMANLAASGGYWVSMASDRIFAEPSTITGSIGVFGIFPTFEKALANYGVTSDGVKTTALSGQPDILAGTNPETDRLIQAGVEDIYRRFLSLVSENRKIPLEKVNQIAQGRVWDGGTARQLGLVDAFGSLDEAFADAAKRIGVEADDVERVTYEEQPSFLSSLLSSFGVAAKQPVVAHDVYTLQRYKAQGVAFRALADAEHILTGSAVQVRCIVCPPMAAATQSNLPKSLLSKIGQ